MTKEDILYRFKDINHAYNDCTAYDNLSRMLDDLISSSMAAGAALVTTGISEINGKTGGRSGMTYEEAKNILQSLIPKPRRGDGKSLTHLLITEALLMGMDALDYKEKYRWTPISEGPPKKDGRYLAYIVNKDDPRIKYSMTCQFIQNSIGDNPWFPDDECASNNVVAWTPLSEEYKEDKED